MPISRLIWLRGFVLMALACTSPPAGHGLPGGQELLHQSIRLVETRSTRDGSVEELAGDEVHGDEVDGSAMDRSRGPGE